MRISTFMANGIYTTLTDVTSLPHRLVPVFGVEGGGAGSTWIYSDTPLPNTKYRKTVRVRQKTMYPCLGSNLQPPWPCARCIPVNRRSLYMSGNYRSCGLVPLFVRRTSAHRHPLRPHGARRKGHAARFPACLLARRFIHRAHFALHPRGETQPAGRLNCR